MVFGTAIFISSLNIYERITEQFKKFRCNLQYISKLWCPFIKTKKNHKKITTNKSKQKQKKSQKLGFDLLSLCFLNCFFCVL